jgi:hypothetical protein
MADTNEYLLFLSRKNRLESWEAIRLGSSKAIRPEGQKVRKLGIFKPPSFIASRPPSFTAYLPPSFLSSWSF